MAIELRRRPSAGELIQLRLAVQAPGVKADEVKRIIEEALHRERLCGCDGEDCFFVLAGEPDPDRDDD
jgi:hypothetical protein